MPPLRSNLSAGQYTITKYNYLTRSLPKRLFNFPVTSTPFWPASQKMDCLI